MRPAESQLTPRRDGRCEKRDESRLVKRFTRNDRGNRGILSTGGRGAGPGDSWRSPEGFPGAHEDAMISLKKLSRWPSEQGGGGGSEAAPPVKPARDAWGVVVEAMTVGCEPVYALSFHRKGTSVYYLHRHYRSREDADRETHRLTHDLMLERTDFEVKYALDVWG